MFDIFGMHFIWAKGLKNIFSKKNDDCFGLIAVSGLLIKYKSLNSLIQKTGSCTNIQCVCGILCLNALCTSGELCNLSLITRLFISLYVSFSIYICIVACLAIIFCGQS